METVDTFAAARSLLVGRSALVPTMGYLHEGHMSLVSAAVGRADTVVVSLFVNPLQFGPGEDLDRYPRDLARDLRMLGDAGADVLFAPPVDEVYPTAPATRVTVEGPATRMEGARRPGHFGGVATVVAKLFAGLQPDLAFFGRKDAQQLAVIRRMTRDLSFPVEIAGGSTVRESDGLALSSRNVFLEPDERAASLALSRGLMAAADAAAAGERSAAVLEGVVWAEMSEESLLRPEYAELADADEVVRIAELDRPSFLAVAAGVGRTRLIDNVWFDADGVADRGIRLEESSVLYEGAT